VSKSSVHINLVRCKLRLFNRDCSPDIKKELDAVMAERKHEDSDTYIVAFQVFS
jgi:hypothetical protein